MVSDHMPSYIVSATSDPLKIYGNVTVSAINEEDAKIKAIKAYKSGQISNWFLGGLQIFGMPAILLKTKKPVRLGLGSYNVVLESDSAPAKTQKTVNAVTEDLAIDIFTSNTNTYDWFWNGLGFSTNKFIPKTKWSVPTLVTVEPIISISITDLFNIPTSNLDMGQTYLFKASVTYLDENNISQPAEGTIYLSNGTSFSLISGMGFIPFDPISVSEDYMDFRFEGEIIGNYRILNKAMRQTFQVLQGTGSVSINTSTSTTTTDQVFPIEVIKNHSFTCDYTIKYSISGTDYILDIGFISTPTTIFNIKIPTIGVASLSVQINANSEFSGASSSPVTVLVT
jgi:hypothetical protein